MAKNDKKKNSVIASILDDLTHLQIDTIIKSGMSAADPPDRIDELLLSLYQSYVQKINVMLNRNDNIDFPFNTVSCKSFADLEKQLEAMQQHMDANRQRMDEHDYIVYLRILSFCKFLKSRSSSYQVNGNTEPSLYNVDITIPDAYSITGVGTRDLAKFKKFFDLGTERIVLQTRFGIDGDIVTRIEENFASKPRQLLIDLHDKHTNLSIGYWQSLVTTAVNLVGKIFNFRNQA